MISAKDLLNYATQLYEQLDNGTYIVSNDEVGYRNCARISYYALFHYLKSIADNLPGEYKQNTGDHQKVIYKLKYSKDKQLKLLSARMNSARAVRVRADYLLDENFTKEEAYKLLEVVKRIFAEKAISKEAS